MVFAALCFLVSLTAHSQDDPEALSILDRFSSRALNAPSVSMDFNLLTVNQAEGTTSSINGSLILNKDKYRLDLKDNIVWFNGKTSWNYLPNEKEVTITEPDMNDNSFQSNPSALFTWYKRGYKTRLLEEKSGSYLIDLYPEDKNSDHIRIRLDISNPSLDLKSLEYKYKNGVTVTVNVTLFDLKQKPDPSVFVFSPEKYKGVEIVDMR
jgi:outer membrane lipoprotein-sorting protein